MRFRRERQGFVAIRPFARRRSASTADLPFPCGTSARAGMARPSTRGARHPSPKRSHRSRETGSAVTASAFACRRAARDDGDVRVVARDRGPRWATALRSIFDNRTRSQPGVPVCFLWDAGHPRTAKHRAGGALNLLQAARRRRAPWRQSFARAVRGSAHSRERCCAGVRTPVAVSPSGRGSS